MLLTGENADLLNLGRIVLVLLLMINGITLGIGYDYLLANPDAGISIDYLDISLQLMVVLTVVIAGYFPTMKPKTEIIKPFYPVNNKYALLLNHTVDLLRPVYFYTFISLMAFYIFSEGFGLLNVVITLLWMYAAVLADNLVKSIIYKKLPQPGLAVALFMAILLTIAGYFVLGLTVYQPSFVFQYAVALIVIFVSGLALLIWSAAGVESRSPNQGLIPEETAMKRFGVMMINLYFRRKTTMVILAIVPVIKVLLLVYLYFFYYRIDMNLGATELFYSYLLMTPALIFTYIHNNLAGFFREVWLSHELCNGKPRILAKTFVFTLLPPLGYDFVLSVLGLHIIGLFAWKYIIFYLAFSAIMLFLGMYSSIYHPRFIDNQASLDRLSGLKNNTSGRISFYCGLIMACMAILIETGWVLWILPFTLALIINLYRLTGGYSLRKHKMYTVLFRQRK